MRDCSMDIAWLRQAFLGDGYICDDDILLPVFLSLRLGKPLLVEGAPGVGKTEIAKVLSRVLGLELIRLQCYEGLDENKALYEWNYQRQLLRIQVLQSGGAGLPNESDLFSQDYLLMRPLLRAIRSQSQSVLLIDEVDKVDEAFEAFLFELLSDFQVSIPELGTMVAREIPVVVLTSNSERDLSDGLKRRCVYLYIGFPEPDREARIIRAKAPGVGEGLAAEIAAAMSYLRSKLNLRKQPSIAEALDWARALLDLGYESLDQSSIAQTAGVILKCREDLDALRRDIASGGVGRMLGRE